MFKYKDSVFNVCRPDILLNKYVLFYNIVFPTQNIFTKHYTLMPDACGTISLAFGGKEILAEIWGASITPTLLGTEPNIYQAMLLIQLSPYGLYQITRTHQAEFADKRFLLEEVDNELFHSLCNSFEAANSIVDLCNRCDKIFYRRMENRIVSDSVFSATKVIFDNCGQIAVGELAKQVGYSERQLNRLFLMQIGMNVKSYARLTRFNYVLDRMKKSPCFFSILSQQAGYFDQSHFDKDFKAISGFTPQNFLKNMSDFYYGTPLLSDILHSKE